MPRFAYSARDQSGQILRANLEAISRKDAARILAARQLHVTSLTEISGSAPPSAPTAPSQRQAALVFSRQHRLPFLQALSDLNGSGMPAGEAVRLLSLRLKDPALRALCVQLWAGLSEGLPLSRALESHPEVFDLQTVNLVSAGEATGNIRDVLERLITHFTEQAEFRRKLIAAMAYPLFICFVAVGVVIFFVLFLLPRLQTLLNSLGGKLPLSTKMLMWFAEIFVVVGPILVVAVIAAVIGIFQWRKTDEGKIASDALLLKTPLAGAFVMRVSVLSFCHTLAVLLENGITTAEALRLAEKTAPNRAMRAQMRAATDRVLEGESLSRALARTGYFPRLLLDRVAVAEQTGNLAPGLRDIARSYRAELDRWLGTISQTISASVLIAAFSFVAFIAFAIVSAVFEVSSSFKF